MSREEIRSKPGRWNRPTLMSRPTGIRSATSPTRPSLRRVGAWCLALLGLTVAAPAQVLPPPGVVPCITNDVPANYGTFLFALGTSYLQSDAVTVQETAAPSSFAWIELASSPSMAVSNAVVASPSGFRADLAETDGHLSRWTSPFASESALATELPPGAWSTRLDITLPDSPPFLGFFRFQVQDRTPPVPRIADPATLDSIDVRSNLVVSWNEWAGITAQDRVHFEIRDPDEATVFSASTGCGGESSLAPGATTVTVPANRLALRTRYTIHLTFGATVSASQDRPTLLVQRVVRTRTTRLEFRTPGPAGEEVVLSEPRVSAAGTHLIFTLTGIPRTAYAIESSADLRQWKLERVTTLPINGAANLSLPLPEGRVPGFWRAVPLGDVDAPATVSLETLGQNRDFMLLTVRGTPGVTYRLESSTNLVRWTPMFFGISIPANASQVNIGLPANRTTRFTAFRAVSGAP